MVNVTAVMSASPRPDIDFFPLSVDFEEKMYAAGKIPGGFIRREGRPSEQAILNSRLIDRPIRPLFPKGLFNDVQVVATVISIDRNCPAEIAGMIGSSVALAIFFENRLRSVRRIRSVPGASKRNSKPH